MKNMKDDQMLEVYKLGVKENIYTVLATALCVGLVAIGTGSLHSLWGLLILLNLNMLKNQEDK